jgi:hypothetical protein
MIQACPRRAGTFRSRGSETFGRKAQTGRIRGGPWRVLLDIKPNPGHSRKSRLLDCGAR